MNLHISYFSHQITLFRRALCGRNSDDKLESTMSAFRSFSANVSEAEDWLVVLFYQYCSLADPLNTCTVQLRLCTQLKLLGRIRISFEGINGVLGGSAPSIHSYIKAVNETVEFQAEGKPIHWKLGGLSEAQMTTKKSYKFRSLSVKVAKEVVSLDLSPNETELMIKGYFSVSHVLIDWIDF